MEGDAPSLLLGSTTGPEPWSAIGIDWSAPFCETAVLYGAGVADAENDSCAGRSCDDWRRRRADAQTGLLARFEFKPGAYGVPSVSAPGVIASVSAVGTAPTTYETYPNDFDATLRGVSGATTVADAVAGPVYYQFNLASAGGLPQTVLMSFNAAAGSLTRPRGFVVRCSLDGYTSDRYVHFFAAGTSLRDRTPHTVSVAIGGAATASIRIYSIVGLGTINHLNDVRFLDESPNPVPTMSEWAMILFGTILAGGTALYIQRRRQSV